MWTVLAYVIPFVAGLLGIAVACGGKEPLKNVAFYIGLLWITIAAIQYESIEFEERIERLEQLTGKQTRNARVLDRVERLREEGVIK